MKNTKIMVGNMKGTDGALSRG